MWWVLKDVCEILGLSEPHRVASRLEKDERTQMTVIDNLGRPQNTTIINEAGLYKVIFRSDKPEAKKFMHWVTHEVLPSIRKHGAYITSDKMEELMRDPDTWIKLIRTLQQERRDKELLQNQIKKDKPKIVFADAVSVSDSDILIGELAKILKGNGIEIGQNRLFERLRRDGLLIRREGSDHNMPSQKIHESRIIQNQRDRRDSFRWPRNHKQDGEGHRERAAIPCEPFPEQTLFEHDQEKGGQP